MGENLFGFCQFDFVPAGSGKIRPTFNDFTTFVYKYFGINNCFVHVDKYYDII